MTKAHSDSLLANSFSSFACSTAAASIYLCKRMNIRKGKGQVVELVHHLAARNIREAPIDTNQDTYLSSNAVAFILAVFKPYRFALLWRVPLLPCRVVIRGEIASLRLRLYCRITEGCCIGQRRGRSGLVSPLYPSNPRVMDYIARVRRDITAKARVWWRPGTRFPTPRSATPSFLSPWHGRLEVPRKNMTRYKPGST